MKTPVMQGFMVLSSVLLASALVSLYLFTASEHVFLTRFREMAREYKLQSYTAAYSCVFAVLQILQEDPAFSPHETPVKISSASSCSVDRIENFPSYDLIFTHARVESISTFLQAQVHTFSAGFSIDAIHETTSIPP